VTDPVIAEIREGITGADEEILAAVNRRLELVARLKRHKEEHGIAFLDPGREAALLAHLREANPGPLSDEGVEELFRSILDLVKREV
jgi:chorismate mutase/prephenate dehydratase